MLKIHRKESSALLGGVDGEGVYHCRPPEVDLIG